MVTGVGLAVVCLGLAPVAKKAALSNGAEPIPLAIASTAVAAVAALCYLAYREPRVLHEHAPQEYFRVFLVGVIGSGAVVVLSILALQDTSATNRSLFQAMYPVATAVFARLLLGERLQRGAYVLIGAMSAGLVLMNSSGKGLELGMAFWLLAATLPLIGLSDVIARKSLCDAQPVFVASGRLVFAVLAIACLAPLTGPGDWSGIASQWWLVGLAGLAMAGGVLGLYRAMDVAGASLAAAFIALAPLLSAAAEWLLFGTTFSALQLTGVAVTVAGAVLLALRTREPPA